MEAADLYALAEARELLENPSLAARLTNFVGRPLESGMNRLPASWKQGIGSITQYALTLAMRTAGITLNSRSRESHPRLHKLLGSISGGAGGAFGLPGCAVETPVSTVLMLRTILDIARAHGEDIKGVPARLAALEVFALGGRSAADDAADSGYYAVRIALARAVSEAGRHLAEKGLTQEGAPALVRLISAVAARYEVQLSQKIAGLMVPGIGAAAGATINYLFMDHFQDMSRGHFTVRHLERKYGADVVRAAYLGLGAAHGSRQAA